METGEGRGGPGESARNMSGTTGLYLKPSEIRICPNTGCLEHLSWRAVCRVGCW